MEQYKPNSLTLRGAVSLGTGVMIGAGIFTLTGQMAELAGSLFPFVFILAAIVIGFSAYSYIKMSNAYPSSGGIAMYLEKAYGKGVITAFFALLMVFSMIISESLVARTFGAYTMQLFNSSQNNFFVPALGAGLILFAFALNLSGNRLISRFSLIMSVAKIGGIAIFALLGLWIAGFSLSSAASLEGLNTSFSGVLAATALGILAYKGFTTITNSGSEIVNPHRNISRAIVISISICVVVYILVALAVNSSLSLPEIIRAKDYSLAEAAKPALGEYGLWFTVVLAMIATISGVIASVFAVSRMIAMLTDMKLVPHRHFGMPGTIQKHTLVYAVVIALLLTIFFDLTRIASLGAIYYLVMDIAVHWGVLRHLRKDINANVFIPIIAILMDIVVLSAFILIKAKTDMFVVMLAVVSMLLIFLSEMYFLRGHSNGNRYKLAHNKM